MNPTCPMRVSEKLRRMYLSPSFSLHKSPGPNCRQIMYRICSVLEGIVFLFFLSLSVFPSTGWILYVGDKERERVALLYNSSFYIWS